MKFLQVEYEGYIWHVPLAAVAQNAAQCMVETDTDCDYEEEFQAIMDYADDAIDWFLNNMDWADVRDRAVLVYEPPEIAEPDLCESDLEVVEVD